LSSKLLTYEEAAVQVAMAPKTLRKWVAEGRLPSVRFSHKAIRIRQVDIDRFVDKHLRKAQED
jgi:excisionase family DNA binding protein